VASCTHTEVRQVHRGASCCERAVVFRSTFRRAGSSRRSRRGQGSNGLLPEDGVDSLVGDVFFVVEGADVGGDECFDAVSEASGGLGEGHAGAEPGGRGGVSAVVADQRAAATLANSLNVRG
jgi:hypothetical protein